MPSANARCIAGCLKLYQSRRKVFTWSSEDTRNPVERSSLMRWATKHRLRVLFSIDTVPMNLGHWWRHKLKLYLKKLRPFYLFAIRAQRQTSLCRSFLLTRVNQPCHSNFCPILIDTAMWLWLGFLSTLQHNCYFCTAVNPSIQDFLCALHTAQRSLKWINVVLRHIREIYSWR